MVSNVVRYILRVALGLLVLMSSGIVVVGIDGAVVDAAGECPSGWTFNSGTKVCERTWTSTGTSASWTVPTGVTSISVMVTGAKGGKGGNDSAAGGAAGSVGQVSGTVSVSAGTSVGIHVGSAGTDGTTCQDWCGQGIGGANPLSGYDGGNGAHAGCTYDQCGPYRGSSGAGGGGGAASVLIVGSTTIVAAGGGGGGGGSQFTGGSAGRTGAVIGGTNGGSADNWGPNHPYAGVGGGGGGGASGGAAGLAAGVAAGKGNSQDADHYSAEGGSAGSNSTAGLAGLTASFVSPVAGSITISYTPQLAPLATTAPTVDATPLAGDISTSTAPVFAGLTGTDTYQWLICDSTSTSTGSASGLSLPAGCSLATGSGATTASYTPIIGDVGKYVRLAVTRTNSEGTYTTISATSANPVGVIAPTAPDLVATSDTGSSSTDNITKDATPEIAVGGLLVGATVTLTATKGSDTLTCSFVATSTTQGCDLGDMSDGTWTLTAKQSVGSVDSATSSSTLMTIDTIAPAAPLLPDLATSSDLGSSSSDDVTSDATPRIDIGGVPNGENVTVTASRPGFADVTCTYVASSTVTGCDLGTLADGDWTIIATSSEVDTAGNSAPPSVALPITVRTAAGQGLAVDLETGSDTGASSTDDLTRLGTVAVGVPGVADGDVVVLTATRTGQQSASCTYTASPTVSTCNLGPLSSGVWDIAATVTDPIAAVSGNVTLLPVTVDLDSPVAPAIPDLANPSDSGSSDNDNLTFDSTPLIDVAAAEIGSTVTVTASRPGFADVVCTFVSVVGTSGCDLPALADGPWSIAALVTDTAGNSAASPSVLDIVVDTTPPVVPVAPDLVTSSDSGASATDNVTFDATPTVSLPNVEIGAVVTLVASRSGFADVSCSYTVTTTVTSCDLGDLADGEWSLSGSAVDTAGNVARTSTPLPIVVDTRAPAEVNGPDLAATSDSGVSSEDDLTSDSTPEIVVAAAEVGSTVVVTATRSGFAPVTCSFVASASVSSCSLPFLADGPWTISNTVTDPAGNVSRGRTSLPIVVDTGVPEVGLSAQGSGNTQSPRQSLVDLMPGSDNGDSSADNITSETTPMLGVPDVEAGTFVVMRASRGGRTVTCSYVASAEIRSCVMPEMVEGTWSVTAEMTDRAGNSLTTPVPLDVQITGVVGRPQTTSATGETSIVNRGDVTTIRYSMPLAASRMRASKVTLALVDKTGRTIRTVTFVPKRGESKIELKVPASAGITKVRVTTANDFGVSDDSPAGTNILECPTSRGVDGSGRPVLIGDKLGNSIIFEPASPVITEAGRRELDRIAKIARPRAGRVLVSGFARQNGIDTATFLRNLSVQRARNAAFYLSQKGVRVWIRYNGFGAVTKAIGAPPDRAVEVRWTPEMITCP